MKFRGSVLLAAGALASVVVLSALPARDAVAEEFDELTAEAATAVKNLFPSATVMGVGMEHEQGVRYYEVVVKDGDRRIEVEVTADGAVGEIESAVSMADLPKAARDRILQATDGATIRELERQEVHGIPRDGTFVPVERVVVSYEVEYEVGGRLRELEVSEDGSWSELEEEEEDDDDDDEDEEGHHVDPGL